MSAARWRVAIPQPVVRAQHRLANPDDLFLHRGLGVICRLGNVDAGSRDSASERVRARILISSDLKNALMSVCLTNAMIRGRAT